MPELVDCYVTLEDIKTRLGGGDVDGGETQLGVSITSACRAIDDHCLQTFTTATTATARTYEPDDAGHVYVDPFHTLTGFILKTDHADDGTYTTTWTSADYDLEYFGGSWGQSIGAPWDTINAVGSYTFPKRNRRRRSVQVTAKWGWASSPQPVIESARIVSVDLWKRKDAPFGIATGTVEFGGLRIGRDVMAQVESLLKRYVRTDRGGMA
ncbi:MAG: hypothetical protein KA129_05720 [Microthrixaceae bacterium]|nr:hypothetical protein [Microthrixaceae bacterium]